MLAFLPTCPHFLGPCARAARAPGLPSSSEIRGPESGSSSFGAGLAFLPPRWILAPGPPICTLPPEPPADELPHAGAPNDDPLDPGLSEADESEEAVELDEVAPDAEDAAVREPLRALPEGDPTAPDELPLDESNRP